MLIFVWMHPSSFVVSLLAKRRMWTSSGKISSTAMSKMYITVWVVGRTYVTPVGTASDPRMTFEGTKQANTISQRYGSAAAWLNAKAGTKYGKEKTIWWSIWRNNMGRKEQIILLKGKSVLSGSFISFIIDVPVVIDLTSTILPSPEGNLMAFSNPWTSTFDPRKVTSETTRPAAQQAKEGYVVRRRLCIVVEYSSGKVKPSRLMTCWLSVEIKQLLGRFTSCGQYKARQSSVQFHAKWYHRREGSSHVFINTRESSRNVAGWQVTLIELAQSSQDYICLSMGGDHCSKAK
jgi:hypothetical protein